jgi:diguanylate cyclase (GGDEF)-like protein
MNKDMIKTWFVALFLITVMWSLGNVSLSYASKILGANAVIYTCSLFLGSALSLLLYAGKGDLGKETLRSADTWGYGLILITGFLVSFGIFMHTTSAEGTLLQRLSIIASSIIGFIFLGKRVGLQQLLGLFLVLIGVVSVAVKTPDEYKGIIYSLIIVFAFLQAGRALLAETHKTHNYATLNRTTKDRVRVVGYIMFVVSIIFLGLSFMFSLIEYSTNSVVSTLVPSLKEFTNPYSIFSGLIVGFIIVGPIRFLEFHVTNKIKAENYLALSAISPFSTLFWEWATSPITHLSLKEFSSSDLLAGIIILIGGLIIAFSKAKKQIVDDVNEYVYQTYTDIESVEDSKDILQKSLTYCNNDLTKLSKLLNLPVDALKVVLEKDNIALKKDTLKRIERTYRLEISSKDSLTGILNRSGLMQNLEKLITKNKDFTLFYIDLNKFKPINDTYGHQAGDEALQTMANRLAVYNKHAKIVSRIGGDEFVIILEKNLDINEFTKNLHTVIEEFFVLPSVNMVAGMSASIGYVKSVDYKGYKAEDLLKIADKMMLALKEKSIR